MCIGWHFFTASFLLLFVQVPSPTPPKRGRPQQDMSKSASKKQKVQATSSVGKSSVSQTAAPAKQKTAVSKRSVEKIARHFYTSKN